MIYCIWDDLEGIEKMLRERAEEFTAVASVRRFGSNGLHAFQTDLTKAREQGKHILIEASVVNIEAIRTMTYDFVIVMPMNCANDKRHCGLSTHALRYVLQCYTNDLQAFRSYTDGAGNACLALLANDSTLSDYFAEVVPVAVAVRKPANLVEVVRAAQIASKQDALTQMGELFVSDNQDATTTTRVLKCRVPLHLSHDLMVLMFKDVVDNAFPKDQRECICVTSADAWMLTYVGNTSEHFYCERYVTIIDRSFGADHRC